MKTLSKLTEPGVAFVGALALVLMMAPVSSYATVSGQVARNLFITTTTAECCVVLGPTVKVNEPATVVPVIVTWSADYIVLDTVPVCPQPQQRAMPVLWTIGGKPVRQWHR